MRTAEEIMGEARERSARGTGEVVEVEREHCLRLLEELLASERVATKEAEDLVMDLFTLNCCTSYDWDGLQCLTYSTLGKSKYEAAQAWLIKRGRIKPEECAYHA